MFRLLFLLPLASPIRPPGARAFTLLLAAGGTLGTLAGCASSDPGGAFAGVQSAVTERAGRGVDVRWNRDPATDAQTKEAVERLLRRGPLTADTAARVAVLNNRSLQAEFEEIGIAHADYIQAGLLSNPEFSTSFRFPNRPPSVVDAEYALAANVLDLFLLPARRKVAARELERTKSRVAGEVLGLIAETKAAVYTFQARQQLVERLGLIAQTNDAAAQLARSLHDAGNITDLEFNTQQAPAVQAQTEAMQAQVQIRSDRERLNRLMSLDGTQAASWRAAKTLPAIPTHDPSTREIESVAVARRLDLAAARTNVDAVGQALALRTNTRFLPASITLGVDTERDTDRQRVTGPTLDLQVPLFDQGQGAIAKLQAQYRQAQRQLEGAEINARSELREARAVLKASRALALRYRDTVVPQYRQIVDQTQVQYNAMQRGGYDLLTSRERELSAERGYLEAWRDYWIARVNLERALTGGSNADMGGTSRAASESVSSPGGISSSVSTRAASAHGTGE